MLGLKSQPCVVVLNETLHRWGGGGGVLFTGFLQNEREFREFCGVPLTGLLHMFWLNPPQLDICLVAEGE